MCGSRATLWSPITLLLMLWFTHGIRAQDGHGPERRYACWGSFGPPVVSAQCPRDTVLHVLRAGLKVQSRGGGAECTYSDADCGCVLGELGCNMPNVRAMCMGRPACRLDVTQQYINTDSCRGFSDYMYIEYNCVPEMKTAVVDICSNSNEQTQQGFIRSPNYPSASTYKQQCQCTLSAPGPFTIQVLDFHNKAGDCEKGRLEVNLDGQHQRLCDHGNLIGENMVSDGDVLLTFDTNGQGTSEGFWLKYNSDEDQVRVKCHLKARSQPSTKQPQLPSANQAPLDEEDSLDQEIPEKEMEIEAEKLNHDKVDVKPVQRANEPQRPYPLPGRSEEDIDDKPQADPRVGTDQQFRGLPSPDTVDKKGPTPWWWRFTAGGRGTFTTVFPTWTDDKPEENDVSGASPPRTGSAENAVAGSSPSLHGSAPSSGSPDPASRPTPQQHDSQQPGKSSRYYPASPSLAKAHLEVNNNEQSQHMHLGIQYYTPYPFKMFTSMEKLQTGMPQNTKEPSVNPSNAPIRTLDEIQYLDRGKNPYQKKLLIKNGLSPNLYNSADKVTSRDKSMPSLRTRSKLANKQIHASDRKPTWKLNNLDDYTLTEKLLAPRSHAVPPNEKGATSWHGSKPGMTTGLSPAWQRKWRSFSKPHHYHYNNRGLEGPHDDYSVSSAPLPEVTRSTIKNRGSIFKSSPTISEESKGTVKNGERTFKYNLPRNEKHTKSFNKNHVPKRNGNQGFRKQKNTVSLGIHSAESLGRQNPKFVQKSDSARGLAPNREAKPQYQPPLGNNIKDTPHQKNNRNNSNIRRKLQKHRKQMLGAPQHVTPNQHRTIANREYKSDNKIGQGGNRHSKISVDMGSRDKDLKSKKVLDDKRRHNKIRQGGNKHSKISVDMGSRDEELQSKKVLEDKRRHEIHRYSTNEGKRTRTFGQTDTSPKIVPGNPPSPRLVWRGHKLVPLTPSASHRSIDQSGDVVSNKNLTVETKPAPKQNTDLATARGPYLGPVHPGISAVERALAGQRAKLREQASRTESPAITENSQNTTTSQNLTEPINGNQVFSHSRNGQPSNQLDGKGSQADYVKPKKPSTKPQGESITVTIIAACVIGSILLIIIIGIVVRFVINRADPNYTMRQNHKKECVIRRNAQAMHRHGF